MTATDEIIIDAAALRFLPEGLLRLAITDLDLTDHVKNTITVLGIKSVADLVALPLESCDFVDAESTAAVRTAIGRAIDRCLPRQATIPFDALDWPSLQGHLLIPLDDDQRALLRALLGIDEAPTTMVHFARRQGMDLRATESLADRTRTRLHDRSRQLITRLRQDLLAEQRAFDGVLDPLHLAKGTLLDTMARANDDLILPLRLAAFCFPHEYHLHGGLLLATPRRSLRRLLEHMRRVLTRHRLPLPLATLVEELDIERRSVPAGIVTHLLRSELRLSLAITEAGEAVVPNPKSPASRLAELLEEEGRPMQFIDLVFAYRERYRRATPQRLDHHLRRELNFVLVGRDTFALRRWYEHE
ncbi:MAG: hypothetical protein KDC98_01420, partial [Planctomycetes bacterium]|nr:hypothetical protein [Planctomycetota bacterium]